MQSVSKFGPKRNNSPIKILWPNKFFSLRQLHSFLFPSGLSLRRLKLFILSASVSIHSYPSSSENLVSDPFFEAVADLSRIVARKKGSGVAVKMPLYDCMLLLKPQIAKEALLDLVVKVGKHVSGRNGVLTDIKSFGTVQLGYGIKKLDGRYFQAQMMQMTMMTPPNFNKELHYLNKEDRLLRWMLVKHRGDFSSLRFDSYDKKKALPPGIVLDESKGDENEDSSDEDEDDDGANDYKKDSPLFRF